MLAFLFTDLEGSTRMWEQDREVMGAALARHDELVRRAILAHGGTVVKSTGDGWTATFVNVTDALAAGVEAQLAIARESWPTREPPAVRMGVHVGEAEAREGDHYGPAVNRAARIMAAARGGQILISGAAARIASDALVGGVTLRDLGTHRLRDLPEAEHLFQVDHPELRSEFPPLLAAAEVPGNLPVQVTGFFGRRAEMAAAKGLLERPDVRLVTLTGAGGTGKTRLALEVAAQVAGRYPDGAFFVSLAAERTPEAAFEAVLRDLGLTGSRAGSPLQVLKAKLRDRRMLLVLDNLEQVTAAGEGIVDLLQHCPGLVAIATSREALRVRGEHVVPVPTLGLPAASESVADIAASEAATMFLERARAASPGFELTSSNAAAVAEIVVRLDGLPLALELAAARLEVFGPAELRDRLRQRTDVLGKGARDLPDRQRTLRSTIAWSYELLEPDDRRLFELLSVFSAPRLAAIEEVAQQVHGALDAVEGVASLVAKSLVRAVDVGGIRRYTMLQTVRGYAAERLAASPEALAAARLAHARYVGRFAASLRRGLEGTDREATLDELTQELGDVRAAWRFWVEARDLPQLYVLLDGMWALHEARGWYHATVGLLTDLLDVLGTTPGSAERDQEEATLRTSLARALMADRGFGAEVEREFRRALELMPAADVGTRRVPVLRSLASYYLNVGRIDQSAAIGRQILELGERERDAVATIEGHVVLGSTISMLGELREGLEHLDLAIAQFDPVVHGSGRFRLGTSPGVIARMASAILLRLGGWPDKAARRADDAVAFARGLDHPFSLAYALYHHAYFDVLRGSYASSAGLASDLAAVAERNDYPVWRALAEVVRGVALCGLGSTEEGLARLEAGFAFYRDLTTPPVFWPYLLGLCALGYLVCGRAERSLEYVRQAIESSGPEEAVNPEFRVLRGDGLMLLGAESRAAAEASYRQGVRGARRAGYRLIELAAISRLAVLHGGDGGGSATDRVELAAMYGAFEEGFDDPVLAEARRVLGGG